MSVECGPAAVQEFVIRLAAQDFVLQPGWAYLPADEAKLFGEPDWEWAIISRGADNDGYVVGSSSPVSFILAWPFRLNRLSYRLFQVDPVPHVATENAEIVAQLYTIAATRTLSRSETRVLHEAARRLTAS